MQPSIGRIVNVFVNPDTNNGSDIAPAIITRVWSRRADGAWTINFRMFLDRSPLSGDLMEHRTSATMWATRKQAEEDIESKVDTNADFYKITPSEAREDLLNSGVFCFWPPRV